MSNTRVIDQTLLDSLTAEAQASPRKRKNFNFHASDEALSHRMLNAIEPESYLVPHRHLDPNKDETMIVLRGRLGIVLFDNAGRIERTLVLEAGTPACGINIPHGVFHTVVAGQSGTVMFESKAGPYRPLATEEFAPWAPPDGAETAAAYAQSLRALFDSFAHS